MDRGPGAADREPVAHRYPAAGTTNPTARLFRVGLDGERAEIAWDREAYPYLATVATDAPGGSVISVLSRDQRRQLILDLPSGSSVPVQARIRSTEPWLTMHPGVPTRAPDGSLLEIIANTEDDCYQLVADGRPLTPADVNVTGLADVSPERLIVTVQPGPLEQQVARLDWDGTLTLLLAMPRPSAPCPPRRAGSSWRRPTHTARPPPTPHG